jgi:hypothetical protein
MKTNKDYFELLTNLEQELFKQNYDVASKLPNKEDFDVFLDTESKSFSQFLASGFFWDGSEQGHEFWSEINSDNRYLPEWTKVYYDNVDITSSNQYIIRSGCKFINLPKRLSEIIAEEMLLQGLIKCFVIPELEFDKTVIIEE